MEELRDKGAPFVVNLLLAELAEVGVVVLSSLFVTIPPGGLLFGGTS